MKLKNKILCSYTWLNIKSRILLKKLYKYLHFNGELKMKKI